MGRKMNRMKKKKGVMFCKDMYLHIYSKNIILKVAAYESVRILKILFFKWSVLGIQKISPSYQIVKTKMKEIILQ